MFRGAGEFFVKFVDTERKAKFRAGCKLEKRKKRKGKRIKTRRRRETKFTPPVDSLSRQ